MANEYLDKDGLKRLVSLVKDEIKQVDSRALTEEQARKIVQESAVTQENDPTVPDWAKQDEKPKYTYEEITDKPTLVEGISASVEGETLTVEIKDKDGNAIANTEVTLPKQELPDFNAYVKAEDFDKEFKRSVTENTETLTDDEKASACSWLGAANKKDVDDADELLQKELDDEVLIIDITITQEDVNNGTNVVNINEVRDTAILIDWGDGSKITKNDYAHTYNAGDYRIKVYNADMSRKGSLYAQPAITYVKVPKSTTLITQEAFRGCVNLKKVDLPEGLKKIGQSSFYYCTSLKSIDIPSTVEDTIEEGEVVPGIGKNAFYRCEAMTEAIFNSEKPLTYNAAEWFNGCKNLAKIIVPFKYLGTYKSAWTSEKRLDSIAYISDIPDIPTPPTMNFTYQELASGTKYPIKRNGYYMVYSNSANLELVRADGTVVVEDAKQIHFMAAPIIGDHTPGYFKVCGMYWSGSTSAFSPGVEGFRRNTNDGGYITASTDFFVAEMVKE